ncbi:MAG: nucleotidyltransferase domain-containing protein [Frankiaceae bacterium]
MTAGGRDGGDGRRGAAPGLGPWAPLAVDEVAGLLAGVAATWWLSGGYALDRFLGGPSRPHGDIDVSVARAGWPAVRAALAGRLELLAAAGGALGDLPADDRALTSAWARDRGGGPWRLQVSIEEVEGARWVYRRDRRVSCPMARAVLLVDGVPCVAPAVQLLWKAKAPRPVDELDYRALLPRLPPADRAWLGRSIRLAHPASPWAARAGLRPAGPAWQAGREPGGDGRADEGRFG